MKIVKTVHESSLNSKLKLAYNGHYNGHIGQNSYAKYVLP